MRKCGVVIMAFFLVAGTALAAGNMEQEDPAAGDGQRGLALAPGGENAGGPQAGPEGPGAEMDRGPGPMTAGYDPLRLLDNEALKKNPVSVEGTVSWSGRMAILAAKNKSYVLIVPDVGMPLGEVVRDGTAVKLQGFSFRPASIDEKADTDRLVVTKATVDGKDYDVVVLARQVRDARRQRMMAMMMRGFRNDRDERESFRER